MGKVNKGWSTGLPDFKIKENMKDTPPAEPKPKTKSRIVNDKDQNLLCKLGLHWFKTIHRLEDIKYSECKLCGKRKYSQHRIQGQNNIPDYAWVRGETDHIKISRPKAPKPQRSMSKDNENIILIDSCMKCDKKKFMKAVRKYMKNHGKRKLIF